MEPLSNQDIIALNRVIGEIYAARDLESFYRLLFSFIRLIIPYDYCSFKDINPRATCFPQAITDVDAHGCNSDTPFLACCVSGYVMKVSDCVSDCRLKGTPVYNEVCRPLDIEMQITFSIPVSSERVSVISLARTQIDFSERDKLLLIYLKPHLITALMNVLELGRLTFEKDFLQSSEEAEQRGVMFVQANGRVVRIPDFAAKVIATYFDTCFTEGDTLPETLLQWFQAEVQLTDQTLQGSNIRIKGGADFSPQQKVRTPMIIEAGGKSLTMKLLYGFAADEFIVSIVKTDHTILINRMKVYGLSFRETEVLLWLSRGKTNAETALILNLSRRTIEKHLERIYTKLNIETRAAAIAILKNELP
jgi:DNA-binding CsgD family transcriptional regulator